MNKIVLLIIFLLINFGGLAIGNWLMDNGPQTQWYLNLNKAPWTPPGWVFGFAWTAIMICFSIYLIQLYDEISLKLFITLLVIEYILNVSWNYVFFNQHQTVMGFIILMLLTAVVFYYFFNFQFEKLKYWRILLIPYMLWLCIANSLNLYIILKN